MKNVLFVHIPKTAGTSIRSALINSPNYNYPSEWMVSHLTHAQLESRCRFHNFKPDYSFTFVRNPYDRAVSTYFHLQKHIKPPHFMRRKSIEFYQKFLTLNFKEWLRFFHYNTFELANYLTVSHHFLLQSSYLDSKSDIKIFKMEDMKTFQTETGILVPKERVNPDRNPTAEMYDDESREMVRTYFKQDFEMFGYEQ
jgi:hypothetical protein